MSDAYTVAPFADVLYFADAKWWRWHNECEAFKAFAGEKCTIWVTGNSVDDPEVAMLRKDDRRGEVSDDPEALCTGSNSGHQALNIALLTGGNPIYLLGYDAREGAGGRKHFFGDHPDKSAPPFDTQIRELNLVSKKIAARGIKVTNCSPGSAIDCFPHAHIEEVLR